MKRFAIATLTLGMVALQLMSCGGPQEQHTAAARAADSLAQVRRADSLAALVTAPFTGVWLINGAGKRGEVQLEAAGDRGINGAFVYEEVDANLEAQSSAELVSLSGRIENDTLRVDLFDPQGRPSSKGLFFVDGDTLRFIHMGAEASYPARFAAAKE